MFLFSVTTTNYCINLSVLHRKKKGLLLSGVSTPPDDLDQKNYSHVGPKNCINRVRFKSLNVPRFYIKIMDILPCLSNMLSRDAAAAVTTG